MERADVVVVGAGIVGLATARAVLRARPDLTVVVLEKESSVGAHQSGRNSGVIHAGVYYQPGSEKARLCTAGRTSMVQYCRDHGIDHAVCGKVVVASDEAQRRGLVDLERRCEANGVRTEMLDPGGLRELEPHVAGVAALHVLDTGIVDYAHVCRALAAEIEQAGAGVRLGSAVRSGSESAAGVVVDTTGGPIEAKRVVTCAGLHADAVARAISGPEGAGGMRVIAFRGEYRELVPTRARTSYAGWCTRFPTRNSRSSAFISHAVSTGTCTSVRTRCSRSPARVTSGGASTCGTCARRSRSEASAGSRSGTGVSASTRWRVR